VINASKEIAFRIILFVLNEFSMILFKKHWKKLVALVLLTPVLIFGTALIILITQQEKLVQFYLTELNENIQGRIEIRKSHIAPFRNFPYISIDLKGVLVYETKNLDEEAIVELEDVYVGFDLIKLLSGKTQIKAITLKDGRLDLIQDEKAELNLAKAFQSENPSDVEDVSEAMNLELKKLKLKNVNIQKHNLENMVSVEAHVKKGVFKIKLGEEIKKLKANCDFILTVLKNGDTTFFKHKNGYINTDFAFDLKNLTLNFEPSTVAIEKAIFNFEGSIDLANEATLDLKFSGEKPNFDMFLSFAPEELAPTLERYSNAGEVYFEAQVNGRSLNAIPHVEAKFGCRESFISNQFNKKKVDQLQFNAFFTTGDSNTLETMYFEMKDFEARPEAGRFKINLSVLNFASPEINLQLDSDFNLEFLADFFEIDNLFQLSGNIRLQMNFHDIIDLAHPEKMLDKIDQAYYAKLSVNNLGFVSPDFHLPIKNITISAETNGTDLQIHKFDAKIGKSDLLISGKLTNIPEIIHHTDEDVILDLSLKSKMLDLKDITQSKRNPEQFIDDQVQNFRTHFQFIGSAKDLTEYKYLPRGRFILDDLVASFKNYPHHLHDFDIDILIEDEFIQVKKFHGEIDDSDFDLEAMVSNYGMFLHQEVNGKTDIAFRIHSKNLILKNLLTYNGNNFLPEDYRDEIFNDLALIGNSNFYFKNGHLKSTDTQLEKLTGKMKLHPLKFENFKGRIKVEDEHLVLQYLSGKLGNSQFTTYLNYYFGENPKLKKRDNYLKFSASRLDIDQLTNYSEPKPGEKVEHDSVFNIYALPFPNMKFELNIAELNYHKQKFTNIKTNLKTTEDHYLYLEKFGLEIAGGNIKGKAYFDGRNKDKIYLNPEFQFKDIDLSKLMLKFDNFGQDELVSNNLTGRISGKLSGKIRVHTDLVPMLDESLIKLEFAVLNGVILKYAPLLALEDFFKDRNLNRIAFDTLHNSITIDRGSLIIPSMTINSTLGFIIFEGTQDQNMNMNYLVRIPFRMVTQAASQRLFKRKKEDIDPDREDDIIFHDPNRRTNFINVRITGTPEKYEVNIERRRRNN
jgi:hypothetical protein